MNWTELLINADCSYLFAALPVTDDIKSLKVRNIPLSATNFVAASDFGYW